MVDRSYMLERPAPPSAVTRFVHQKAIPLAIDAAATMEMTLEQAAIAARQWPLIALSLAVVAGGALGLALSRRRVG